jgi:mannose-6-phosphate isomerase-like protein (cupin superfamily)
MQQFELPEEMKKQAGAGRLYHEFIRHPSLSMGFYRLRAGSRDPQLPHAEDEVYYVVAGQARFVSGEVETEVKPGTILFVPAGEAHRFYDITAELQVLVFFAPAESE